MENIKLNEKIKYLFCGILICLLFLILFSFTDDKSDNEIGRYQISGDGGTASLYILDTKTGIVKQVSSMYQNKNNQCGIPFEKMQDNIVNK